MVTDLMKCKKPEISELLPWLINGTLTTDEAQQVNRHVDQCAVCKSKLEKMRWISAQIENCNETLCPEHVWPEMLVDYVEARSELTRSDILSIEKHLESCTRCRNEMEILRKVNASLPSEPVRTDLPNRIKDRLTSIFQNIQDQPAWIYVIILILLVPAYMGIFKWRPALQRLQQPQVAESVFELDASDLRSDTAMENVITLPPGTGVFSFSFHVPVLDSEQIRYDAFIMDSRENVIWQQKDIKSLDSYGTFLLICGSQFFKEGLFTLKVYEMNRSGERMQNVTAFSLQIVKP